MPVTKTVGKEEAGIRECLDPLAQAIRTKDITALMAHYAPDVVTYDLLAQLQVQGVAAYRKNFEAWFTSVHGPIDYETRNLRISTDGDLAVCHYLAHVKSTRKTGEKSDYWVRVTSGFRRMNGQWMVTHEHVSMPHDMATIQAASGLQP